MGNLGLGADDVSVGLVFVWLGEFMISHDEIAVTAPWQMGKSSTYFVLFDQNFDLSKPKVKYCSNVL